LLIASLWTGGFGLVGTAADDAEQPEAPAPAPTVIEDVDIEGDPIRGSEDAEVLLVELSDFQCLFCGRFVANTLPEIEENYVDTGKVRHVFKDFPLSFHDNAHIAAEAAECADDQGKFWAYHDLIFENQADLSEDKLTEWATDLGLDEAEFESCLEDGTHEDEVDADMKDGQAAGISGTPSFLIGNAEKGFVKLVGAQPYSAFEEAIEDALA
jgi:protein-disulfide isomerase